MLDHFSTSFSDSDDRSQGFYLREPGRCEGGGTESHHGGADQTSRISEEVGTSCIRDLLLKLLFQMQLLDLQLAPDIFQRWARSRWWGGRRRTKLP
jgi:hypothetical protein